MSLKKIVPVVALVSCFGVTTAEAVPIFDTFGTLSEATFGGSGIPNDEVAIGTAVYNGNVNITAGLTATQRFSNPAVDSEFDDGNFTAGIGTDDNNGNSALGALWNFSFYINIDSDDPNADYSDLQFDLYYDFDPGEDTPRSQLGRWDITTARLAEIAFLQSNSIPVTPVTTFQGSQNLLFDFLENPQDVTPTPFDFFITPPAGSFDPNATGEYNFAIVVSDPLTEFAVEIVAIDVEVVPEPTSLAMLGLGGLLLTRRRRR